MRYADVRLEVFLAGAPAKPAASVEIRLNLSADNLAELGQAGLYVLHGYPPDKTNRPWRLYVRNFAVRQP